MNNDLISREALKEEISDKIDERYRWDSKLTVCEFKTIVGDIIDNAPTVEYPFYQEAYQTGYEEGKNERPLSPEVLNQFAKYVAEHERPQGEWIEKRIDEQYGNPPHGYLTRYQWECSVCGDSPYYSNDIHTLNYCPNCGADMRGGQE